MAGTMSEIFKFTLALVLLTIMSIALSISTGYESAWQVGTVFLMPVLWVLWIACVVSHKTESKISRLILLWALIDLAVLLVNRLMMGSFHAVDLKGGSELAWVIEFFPVILPIIPAMFLPVLGPGLSAIMHGASFILLPAGFVGVLKDWIECSILSASASYAFAHLWFYWKGGISARKRVLKS